MRKHNQLSAVKLITLKPGKHHDGHGLYLYVGESGYRCWVLKFMRDGQAREMGLGPLHTVNLAEARERARIERQMLVDGRDPIAARDAQAATRRAEQLRTMTFRQAVTEYLRTGKVEGFKNAKHRKQWRSTLEGVFPVLGSLPLNDIGPAAVLEAIKPIWGKTPETASRLLGRIRSVFNWAKPIGCFSGDNPAEWDLLKHHLPARDKVEHHKALPYAELPAFMAELRKRDSLSAAALAFTILTATRTSEVIGAKWSEVKGGVWTIPAARMKAKRNHRVPLCKQALAILKSLPRKSEYIFANGGGNPLSNMAMLELLRGMAGNGYTVHGFRSAFSDWARDKTKHPRDVVELALAHGIKDKSEAAYRRGDALDKRRKLMADWSSYANNK